MIVRTALAWLAFAIPGPAVAQEPQADAAARVFTACASCHGADGSGTSDGNVPRISGQRADFIAKQLADYQVGKRWDSRMERYADRHVLPDARAIAAIAAHVSSLRTAQPAGTGEGVLVGHGATLYDRRCRSCHDVAGNGRSHALAPKLRGQHYEYLLRQMHDAIEGRRPNFTRAHVRLLAKLERDDLTALADFLSRSQWERE